MPANLPNKTHTSDRRSACPGLFRMTSALDGHICRIKLPLGRITCKQADEIARLSHEYGNGILELTIRSNLQLRGVREDQREKLIVALLECGLGPLLPEGDDVRNVMVNPTAGIDRSQMLDTTKLAQQLLQILQLTPRYHTLSPKFSLMIDGGEACAMTTHPSDIWLSACDDGQYYAAGFASTPNQSGILIKIDEVQSFITTCLDVFLTLAEQFSISRIKQLFVHITRGDFIEILEQHFNGQMKIAPWRRHRSKDFAYLGQHQQKTPQKNYVGVMPVLGRLSPEEMQKISTICQSAGSDYFCLTPWQSFLIPNIDTKKAPNILKALQEMGFASQHTDITANIRACSGSKGCAAALADTQSDARQLALLLGDVSIPNIHLTGCPKSCAAFNAMPVTLLATKPHHYDLFLQDKTGRSRFGRLLASDIKVHDAAQLLQQHRMPKPTGTGNV